MHSAHSLLGVNNVGTPASHNTIHLPRSTNVPHNPYVPHTHVALQPMPGFMQDQYNLKFPHYYHQQHQAPPYTHLLHGYVHGPPFPWGHHQEEDDGHPFTYDVMAILVPTTFKQPTNLEAYDGSINPQEHLKGFRATMLLLGAPDAIMCHAFSTTLKKDGL